MNILMTLMFDVQVTPTVKGLRSLEKVTLARLK